jgi:hypothetical protein
MNKKTVFLLMTLGVAAAGAIILTNKYIDKLAKEQAKKNFTPDVAREVNNGN